MRNQFKSDIMTILWEKYNIPGKFSVVGVICLYLWFVTNDLNIYSWFFLLFALLLFIKDGIDLYKAAMRLVSEVLSFFNL